MDRVKLKVSWRCPNDEMTRATRTRTFRAPPVRQHSRDSSLIASMHPHGQAEQMDSTDASEDPDGAHPSAHLHGGT